MKPLDVTLAERGQMVIPKEARDALGLKAGSRLRIRLEGNRLILEKKVALDLNRWVGKAVDDGLSRDEALAELRGRLVPGPKASELGYQSPPVQPGKGVDPVLRPTAGNT